MKQRFLALLGWLSLVVVVYVPLQEWRQSRERRALANAIVDSLFASAGLSDTSSTTILPAATADRNARARTNPVCTEQTERPQNGMVLGSGERRGRGALHVDNGTMYDAVAVLESSENRNHMWGVLVKAGESASLNRVPIGDYSLRFLLGEGFSSSGEFCRRIHAARFDSRFSFQERRVHESDSRLRVQYAVHTVTLHLIRSGNATTLTLDPATFEIPR